MQLCDGVVRCPVGDDLGSILLVAGYLGVITACNNALYYVVGRGVPSSELSHSQGSI